MTRALLPEWTIRAALLLIVLCCGGSSFLSGQQTSKLKLVVQGSEQQTGSSWDQGSMTISVNGVSKSYQYGQFATPQGIAAAFGAYFSLPPGSSTYCPQGVCAKAQGATILFTLPSGSCFQQVSVTTSSSSFSAMQPPTPPCGIPVPTLTCSQTSLPVGGSLTCTAQVTPGTTSKMTFLIDNGFWESAAVDPNGTAIISKSLTLNPGIHTVTVSYLESGTLAVSSPVSLTLTAPAGGGTSTIYSFSITDPSGNSGYAANGNILAYTDSVNGTWSLTYDNLNRLTGSQMNSQRAGFGFACWLYDSFGNRIAQAGSSSALDPTTCQPTAAAQSVVDTQAFSPANQITSRAIQTNGQTPVDMTPGYDGAGNVSYDPTAAAAPQPGSPNYLYDAEGRICASHGADGWTGYLYDANGQRVAKGILAGPACDPSALLNAATSQYILGPDGSEMTEVDGSGQWVHTNVQIGGGLMATYTASGLHFNLTDWLGTRRVQTDYAGMVEDTCQSMPFGDGLSCTGTNASERQFTGKERDTETGLDYFGARYLSSSMGRFMSPDWAGMAQAVPYAQMPNPQTLNLYAYVGNNPLRSVDWDGHVGIEYLDSMRQKDEQEDFERAYASVLGNVSQQTQNPPQAQQQSGQPAADPAAPAAGQTPAASGGFQFNAELMTDRALYYTGTFASGASDFMTLGLTKYINEVDGGASSIGYDSGTYTAGKVTGIGLTVAGTAVGGLTRGALSEGKVVGGLFGRGGAIRGGVFNRGFIRFGWSWEGSAQGGRDVIRIGIGEAGSWIHIHIPVWYP